MSISRHTKAFVIVGALLTPGLALAQQAPRLQLALADTDHDGRVSEAERAISLARTTAEVAPVATPASARPRARPDGHALPPGPLDMARRIAPASEFELALEERFNREVERRRKD